MNQPGRGIEMSDDDKGFVIKDRRLFAQDAGTDDVSQEQEESRVSDEPEAAPEPEPVVDAEAPPAHEPDETPAVEDPVEPPPVEEQQSQSDTGLLPEVTFSSLVFSLASSVLLHLGELPDPNTSQTDKNLPLAKQTIDILNMLEKKTEGNLDEEEKQLLTSLLYEMRMKYVEASKP